MNKIKHKKLIDLYSKSYLYHKRLLLDYERGAANDNIEDAQYIVKKIEDTLLYLDEDERFIIQHEVINNAQGCWYLQYMSSPTYYRHRKTAYSSFLRCLER